MAIARNELADAALAYASRGWKVIALHFINTNSNNMCSCNRARECRAAGKHPIFKKWREVATTDPVWLRSWWKTWPKANVGLTMGGLSSLITIDLDGPIGRESLATLEGIHGPLPSTLTQSTGREGGGEHRLFHVDPFYVDWIRNRAHLAPSIDIRAEGGLIVAAPSMHSSGLRYRWHDSNHPIAELPKWMFDLALSRREQQRVFSPNGSRPPEGELQAMGWPLAKRITAARQALPEAVPAVQGQNGSRDCLRAAFLVVRGFCIPSEQAFDMLWEIYNPKCTPMWNQDELMHKVVDAENTVTNVPWKYKLDTVVDHETLGSLSTMVMTTIPSETQAIIQETMRQATENPQAKVPRQLVEPEVPVDQLIALPQATPAPAPKPTISMYWDANPILRGDTQNESRGASLRLRELPEAPPPPQLDEEPEETHDAASDCQSDAI